MPPPPKPRRSGIRKSLTFADAESFASDAGRVNMKSTDINDDAAEKRRRRKSMKIPQEPSIAGSSRDGDDGEAARKKRLTAVQPPVINVPSDVKNSNFEEWMKMHTDGKINAANSWDIFLIDYFHDMSLLKDGDDNTINFQRASYTLDGCVKLWTTRVDSVGTDSAKLASNLASGRNDIGEDSGDEDLDDPAQPKKKRAHRSGATLKEASQLRSKKIETEFLVDPLFKKTCADFDEGGAQGLLMNHLSLGVGKDGGLRVVFDAGDSLSKGDDDDDFDEPEDYVDLSILRNDFIPDMSILDDLEICPELADFAFQKDASSAPNLTISEDLEPQSDEESAEDTNMNVDEAPVADYFDGPGGLEDDDHFGGDFGGDNFGGDDDGDEHSNGSVVGDSNQNGEASGSYVPFDPRNTTNEQRSLLVSMDANSGMDYFDNDNSRNWAGPEHYKSIKKIFRRAEKDASKPKVRREKKEAVKIDFSTPPDKPLKAIAEELFRPSKTSINLPNKKNEKKTDHRLPDDMHFTSRQLISLFLKPKFSLTMRGRNTPGNPTNEEVDENFWAQAAANQAAGRGEGDDNDAAIPTQFFQDDFDDGPGFDDGFDAVVGLPEGQDEEELLAATQGQSRRVRPPTVNYAKRAKRVDVKRLKDNIWKGLDIVTPHAKKEDGMDVDDTDFTDPADARDFKSVITSLQRSYPEEKMEEISTSFCFICLLHLANEQGLRLEEGETTGEQIGKLWDVKVSRTYRSLNKNP
ncbi:condensin complex subunit 2/barren [Mucidula mucida]|nr:condensin complex subunit 2/barren [Mucidula mucida]